MLKLNWSFCGLLILAMTQPTLAAQRLGPPIEDLQSVPDRIRIVIAVANKKTVPASILFSINERLSGESPDEVLLRTDEATYTDVKVGRSYIVAWSDQRRNRRVVGGWEEDPDGPFIVQLMGLGVTALFEDTPHTRFLFTPGAIAKSENSSGLVNALLAQLQSEDFRSSGLVISELYLRPDLTELMDKPQVEKLQTVLQTRTLDPQHRDFLLRSALRLPQDLTSPWLGEEFRKIIIEHGTRYDLSSFVPGLVRTAARGLQQTGTRSDIDLLSILLYSNNPGVCKAALSAMNHIDPEATAVKAKQALERGWIHDETERELSRYISR